MAQAVSGRPGSGSEGSVILIWKVCRVFSGWDGLVGVLDDKPRKPGVIDLSSAQLLLGVEEGVGVGDGAAGGEGGGLF